MDVTVITTKEIIFKEEAENVILPGENGVFEILPFHKNFISRLIKGNVQIDNYFFLIRRGVVKVELNKVMMIIEKDLPVGRERFSREP